MGVEDQPVLQVRLLHAVTPLDITVTLLHHFSIATTIAIVVSS